MTQLKTVFIGLILATAITANADTLNGLLDLSNLYGKTNAGQYELSITVSAHRDARIEVTQSLANSPDSDQPGDGPQVCLTEFTIQAGQVNLQLKDKRWGSEQVLSQNVMLNSYHYDESESCSTVDEILSANNSFMPYFNLGAIQLKYPAPFNYEKLFVRLSVFPYGHSVRLNVSKNDRNELTITNLNAQLSAQIKRNNKEGLSYYTYAEKGLATLSLGTGYVELK